RRKNAVNGHRVHGAYVDDTVENGNVGGGSAHRNLQVGGGFEIVYDIACNAQRIADDEDAVVIIGGFNFHHVHRFRRFGQGAEHVQSAGAKLSGIRQI